MLDRLEEMNRLIWEGHTRVLEDTTHVIGGIGLGLLAYPLAGERARPLAALMIGLSAALHLYAFVTSPAATAVMPPLDPA